MATLRAAIEGERRQERKFDAACTGCSSLEWSSNLDAVVRVPSKVVLQPSDSLVGTTNTHGLGEARRPTFAILRTSDFLITGVLTSGLRSAVAGSGSESNRWTRSFDSSSTGNRSCAKADVPQKTPPESKVVETGSQEQAANIHETSHSQWWDGTRNHQGWNRPVASPGCTATPFCRPGWRPSVAKLPVISVMLAFLWATRRGRLPEQSPPRRVGPTKNARPIERASCLPNSRSVKRQASS